MSDKQTLSDRLGTPFPQSAIQIHPQTKLKYVAGHTYIHRLNDATGNTWDWKLVRQDFHPYGATGKGNARLLITVIGELTIPGLGTRAGMGVQVVTADTGGEDMWKGAMTDAIKAAAKLFGVGLELYGPDYEAGEVAHTAPAVNVNRVASREEVADLARQVLQQRPRFAGATETNATPKPAQDDDGRQLISQGQLNVITKHQKDLGWSNDDMKLIVASHKLSTIKEFNTGQARALILIMSDPAKADPYIALLRKPNPATQAQMIDTTDASARARK
jgi:hypothetical protein